jgi:hypothetical protein
MGDMPGTKLAPSPQSTKKPLGASWKAYLGAVEAIPPGGDKKALFAQNKMQLKSTH